MRKLCQRIVLIHELGQLGTSEELLDRCRYRTDIHQSLRRSHLDVLNSHPLLDDSLHPGQTDSELILKQLAYGSQSSVAQVVDIVHVSYAVVQIQNVADRCNNVFYDNVLRRQIVLSGQQHFSELAFVTAAALQYFR